MLNILGRLRSKPSAKSTPAIHFIGYPKTGNTWLRFLLGRYLQRLTRADELLLLEGTSNEIALLKSIGVPPIAFTHEPLTWDTQTAADLTIDNTVDPFLGPPEPVIIVRHPLDALVSAYFHNLNQAGHESRKQFDTLETFIEDSVRGLEKLIKFYVLWDQPIKDGGAFRVRYEDLKSNPRAATMNMLAFVTMPINSVLLDEAVEFASFDNMKKMEKENAPSYKSSGFRVFATGDRSNPDAFHVRSGKVGGYKDHLSAEKVAEYEAYIAKHLPASFGY